MKYNGNNLYSCINRPFIFFYFSKFTSAISPRVPSYFIAPGGGFSHLAFRNTLPPRLAQIICGLSLTNGLI